MTEIQENISLKPYNTFGIDAHARYFTVAKSAEDIQKLTREPQWKNMPWLILGGGSNVLFSQDFPGLVIKNEIKGIRILSENEDEAVIQAYSGEVWHEVVMFCIQKGWGGVENLSLIPGTIGAAPMQNIGAYGVELKDVFLSLQAIRLSDGVIENFDLEACAFGYRESIFKKEAKGQYFILSVTLKLQKKPKLNVSYGFLQKTLDEFGISEPDVVSVSEAVCHIRRKKLPDPAVIGNAGSFFKNPEVTEAQYEALKQQYPDMPGFPVGNHMVKLSAGWLIEACDWKGKKIGNTGTHVVHALVLVNYGGASGNEVLQLAKAIQQSVKEKFGVDIYPEVNVF